MSAPHTLTLPAVALAAIALLLAGCDTTKPVSGQVVARVNDGEITVHQLNRSLPAGTEAGSPQRRETLDRLVRRELAVEQAQAMQLDRQPEVMLRLEEARRDVLAAAWGDQLAATRPMTDDGAAARYFGAHPGLFAERKLYRLKLLTLPAEDAIAAELQAHLKQGARLPDIRGWLTGKGIRFNEQQVIRLAEQLPLEAVDRLWQLSVGQTTAFRSPQALTVYQLQSADPQPVDWKTAEPVIREHLAAQARSAVVEAELQRLRTSARIAYADGYAR